MMSHVPRQRTKNVHGQYFTPRSVADLMVRLSSSGCATPTLEPSSGQGVFLDALADAGFTDVEAVEIDPVLARHPQVPVHCQSFLTFSPARKYGLIIGNPPYIRWKDLPEEARQEMRDHALYGELFNSLSDYLTAFIAGSVELLSDGGELIFVTPSFWMHTLHSGPLRDWVLSRGTITDVVDFGEAQVFPKVASSIVIFRFVKSPNTTPAVSHHLYVGPRKVSSSTLKLEDSSLFVTRAIRPFQQGSHWTMATEEELVPVEGLERACTVTEGGLFDTSTLVRLGQFVQIANGMVSGLDRAFQISREVQELLSEVELAATLRVSKAMQLTNYVALAEMRYVDIPLGLSIEQVRNRYPNLLKCLEPYQEDLRERYSYGRDIPYWEWAFRRSETFLRSAQAKGFIPCKERLTSRDRVRVALVEEGVVAVQDVTAFAPLPNVQESIEYVVAYLNHPWITKWIMRKGLLKGGVAEFSEKPLSEIPFRRIEWDRPDEVQVHGQVTHMMRAIMKATDAERERLDAAIVASIDGLLRMSR